MNDDNKKELARRAVTSDHWRLIPGMRLRSETADSFIRVRDEWEPADHDVIPRTDFLPVLDDPATLGCLLALVREAWGDDTITCVTSSNASDLLFVQLRRYDGLTNRMVLLLPSFWIDEAEALVCALEAAP